MAFSKHLFISYTHIDNQKIAGQQQGWVSLFHETLGSLLAMRLGEEAAIWRDNKLAGNDEFAEEILAQIPEVATLVCILSPKYLKSEWCKKEASAFCCTAKSGTGIQIERKSRIFKVMKLPVSNQPEGLPEEFGRATGFPFYKSKDDVPFELDPAYGPEMVGEFNRAVAILAQKLAETVEALRQASEPDAPVTGKKGTIFLTETSWDRDSDRQHLEAELSGRGYLVLPDRDLPAHEDACRGELKKMLAGCVLAIHIIGNMPGMVPKGPSQKSVDELQNEMAAAESEARGIPRVIWMPNESQSTNPAHQQFLNRLDHDDRMQRGGDVVKGDIEVLKGAVLQSLQKLELRKKSSTQDVSDTKVDAGKLIYVICDKRDNKATIDFRKALSDRGFEPRRPLFDGDAGTVRQQNDSMLAQCGLVVLFWGAGDKDWYQNTKVEVEKAKPRASVWTYLATPVSSHKELLLDQMEGGPIINGMSGAVAETELDRMLSGVQDRAGSTGATS